jgi:hypothetical protein
MSPIANTLAGAWQFIVRYQNPLEVASAIIGVSGTAWWWGRRALLAVFGWFLSILAEARPEAKSLSHPLLVQAGDRRSKFLGNMPSGQDTVFRVNIAILLTNLEEKEVHIGKVRLRYSRWPLLWGKKEGDLQLVDPFDGPIINHVVPARRMVHGSSTWTFLHPLAHEPRAMTVRVCVVDSFGRESWSEKIKIPWMNDPERFL